MIKPNPSVQLLLEPENPQVGQEFIVSHESTAEPQTPAEPEPASVGYAPGAGSNFSQFRKRGQHYVGWTAARIDHLKMRWSDGASCRIIGAELGITRNAVIGKARRLDLSSRKVAPAVKKAKTTRARKAVVENTVPLIVELPIEYNPVTFSDLRLHHCRWPVHADGEPALFCGGDAFLDFSYCLHHCSIAYRDDRDTNTNRHIRAAIRNYRRRQAA